MSCFIGLDTVSQLIDSEGAGHLFNEDLIKKISFLVEMETRHVLQTSCKFMIKDRRDTIEPEDVYEAARDNGHEDLIIEELNLCEQDPFYSTDHESFQEEISMLEKLSINEKKLEGKWIYIDGKIPKLSDNIQLRSLSQLQADKSLESDQKKTLVNIIKDNPLSMLTNEQAEYFEMMCEAVRMNINPKGNFTLDGDLNSLLPFFLKFLGEEELNQTGVCFLLKLIDNKYIWLAIEYNLKKILMLLLTYQGEYSFEVGVKIAQLIERFEVKYPMLRDIFVGYQDKSYSTLLKKIPLQLELGITFQVDEMLLQRCRFDSKNQDEMAQLFMRTLLSYSSKLKNFRELLMKKMNTYVYWHPCHQLRTDPYLRML